MGWLMELFLGVCLIILCGGLVNWVNIYLEKRKGGSRRERKEMEERLASIEQRLTDVQDVMIALSEKFDRWEMDRAKL